MSIFLGDILLHRLQWRQMDDLSMVSIVEWHSAVVSSFEIQKDSGYRHRRPHRECYQLLKTLLLVKTFIKTFS